MMGAIRLIREDANGVRLLTARDVAEMTGMSYEYALAFVRVHGLTLPGGKRKVITLERMRQALNDAMGGGK